MSNELFGAFIKWMVETVDYEGSHSQFIHAGWIADDARQSLNDQDTIEQQALNYFIDQYDAITQS